MALRAVIRAGVRRWPHASQSTRLAVVRDGRLRAAQVQRVRTAGTPCLPLMRGAGRCLCTAASDKGAGASGSADTSNSAGDTSDAAGADTEDKGASPLYTADSPLVLYASVAPTPVKVLAGALSFQALATLPMAAALTYYDVAGVRSLADSLAWAPPGATRGAYMRCALASCRGGRSARCLRCWAVRCDNDSGGHCRVGVPTAVMFTVCSSPLCVAGSHVSSCQ